MAKKQAKKKVKKAVKKKKTGRKKVTRPKRKLKGTKRKTTKKKPAVRKKTSRKKVLKKKKTVRKKKKTSVRKKPVKGKKTTRTKPAKKTVKKPTRKAAARRKSMPAKKSKAILPVGPGAGEEKLGLITHYYNHLGVAVVKLERGILRVGDAIHIKGHTTDLEQRVDSMEVDHQAISQALSGQEFGMKVAGAVREHDLVCKAVT